MDDIIQKAIYAKHATRETCHHHILTLGWELKEAERHMELLKAVEKDCKVLYVEASEEAEFFKRLLSLRSSSELDNDINFLHQVYEEDMSAFSTCEEQLNQLEGYALCTRLAQVALGSDECASSVKDDITT